MKTVPLFDQNHRRFVTPINRFEMTLQSTSYLYALVPLDVSGTSTVYTTQFYGVDILYLVTRGPHPTI